MTTHNIICNKLNVTTHSTIYYIRVRGKLHFCVTFSLSNSYDYLPQILYHFFREIGENWEISISYLS